MRVDFSLYNFKNRSKIPLGAVSRPLEYSQVPNMHYPIDFNVNSIPLINFTAACSETGFKIKEIKNLRCPVCNLTMLNDEQMKEFSQQVSSKKGENLARALDTFGDTAYFTKDPNDKGKPVYRSLDIQVVEIIKELALKIRIQRCLNLFKLKQKNVSASL